MSSRWLGLAVVALIQLCLAAQSRANTTNAAIPYKTMDDLCQIAAGADQSRLFVQVFVSSRNKAVQGSDITLTIQSAKEGNVPLQISTNGQILNFPHRKELVRENPFIIANQPKGTLSMYLRYEVPPAEELTFKYSRLGNASAEANKMIKSQAGLMSWVAPKSKGVVFVFPKESAGRAKVSIRAAAGSKEFTADDKGMVKLKLENSLLSENPDVQLSEKPQMVLPDIE